jgi:hypothetical protein
VAPSQPSTPSRENHQHTNHRQSSNISRRHFSSRVHTPTSTNELFPESGHTALTNVPRCTSHGVLTTSNIGSTCVEQARNIFRRQIIIAASESRRFGNRASETCIVSNLFLGPSSSHIEHSNLHRIQ